MVAQLTLDQSVWVQILVPQPTGTSCKGNKKVAVNPLPQAEGGYGKPLGNRNCQGGCEPHPEGK